MLVTVLMPVHNGERFLKEAIDSILNQTFRDFEFLIINDGSTDNSESVVRQYKDPRIRYVSNERNLGLYTTLNKGMKMASGKFIARMDCDDISHPERLQKQISFMCANPEIGACGTWYREFEGRKRNVKLSTKPEEVKLSLLEHSGLGHPTVIFNKQLFLDHQLFYKSEYPYAADWQLWVEASRVTSLANIPRYLLDYRWHKHQMTSSKKEVFEDPFRIRKGQLEFLNITIEEEELKLFEKILTNSIARLKKPEQEKTLEILDLLYSNGDFYQQEELERWCSKIYWRILGKSQFNQGDAKFKLYFGYSAFKDLARHVKKKIFS